MTSSPAYPRVPSMLPVLLLTGCLLVPFESATAQASLDFEFTHGTIVTDQYEVSTGILISAVSHLFNGVDPNDEAIVFDTETTGTTEDPDLQRWPDGWDGGNLPSNYDVGGALILPENNEVSGGLYTNPDDNASGGYFNFAVANGYHYGAFSTVLVDFEEDGANWKIQITGRNNVVANLTYGDIITPSHPLYDPSIESGDNYINQLPSIDATAYGIDEIANLRISLDNSSGAIGSIFFETVPEPSTALLGMLGSLTLLRRRRNAPG